MAADIFVNPKIRHAILVEPTRIVGRTLQSALINIEAERPISRLLGGYVIYFSVDLPFAVDRGAGWECDHKLVVIRPYQSHRLVRCEGLRTILIEPESVCPQAMEDAHWCTGTDVHRAWVKRIEAAFNEWETLGMVPDRSIDQMIFGENLPSRPLDPRIARVIEQISHCPSDPESHVLALAGRAGFSASRLSHLFRSQLDIPIRSFRAWKRARNSIVLTVNEPVLLNAALDAGYADEPHYSRSMRKYFGQHAHVMQRHWRHAMTFRAPEPQWA